ncbi:Armadillo repeat-containing protein 8 [Entomortierella chlamydospora]|uniref:Armadillo repeat-containing protein 8 n=1 Tax=Entomortierella chlamydospora TaxID=101097 RepID=A0A9P6MF23_9FUNG|nr:Armadillo repeat-containing protein 8 [Entomortierella chlamydospora]
MERGIVAKFVQMIGYGDNIVRLNVVWAIKNLVFEADSDVKEAVMRQFGYHNLARLLNDRELSIQEQALNLVRNLACKKEQDIDKVFNGLGHGQLLSIIEDKLTWDDPSLLEHALYVLVNIATGSEHHKQSIMKRPLILKSVIGLMSHESAAIRVATVWVIINLTWPDEKMASGAHDRTMQLRNMGVEDRLLSLNSDLDLDVRDRVKTALHHFFSDQQQYGLNGSGMSDQSNSTGNSRLNHNSRNTSHNVIGQSQDPHTTNESFVNAGMDTSSTLAGSGTPSHERR